MSPAAQIMALFAALMIPFLIITVVMIVAMWMIYSKAGKPGWACIVPIYGMIVMLEIIGKPWWYIFMFLIPIYGWFILPIICLNLLSKSFGQGVGFTLGLLFVGIVFYPILAFSSSIKYVGPGGVAPATIA